MAFTLRIKFSGLCLFSHQAATGSQPARIHVLMPTAVQQHRHIPVLQFDAAHLTTCGGSSEVVAQILLREYALTIDGPLLDPGICSTIVDLREITGAPVMPSLYDSNPGGLLASRITLTGGRMASVDPGVTWEWVSGTRRLMAHVAVWEIDLPGDAVRFRLENVGGGTGATPPVLPLLIPNSHKLLNVSIRHLPPEELALETPPVSIPTQADHVAMYYPLFSGTPPVILPKNPQECQNRGECDPPVTCSEDGDAGESAFNCMLAVG